MQEPKHPLLVITDVTPDTLVCLESKHRFERDEQGDVYLAIDLVCTEPRVLCDAFTASAGDREKFTDAVKSADKVTRTIAWTCGAAQMFAENLAAQARALELLGG